MGRRGTRVAVALALAVAVALPGAVTPAAAQAAPFAWAPGEPCPDLVVVGAAGSGQRRVASRYGMGAEVDGIAHAIAVAADGRRVAALPLDYPAALPETLTGYLRSVEEGVRVLPEVVGEVARSCPETAVVLVGFSQGAHVIQLALERIRSSAWGGGDHSSRIEAVVLIASPVFQRQPGLTQLGTFDPDRRGLLGGVAVAAWAAADTITICRRSDLICQGGDAADLLAFGLATLDGAHRYLGEATARTVASQVLGLPDPTRFSDVPVGHVFEDEVAWLAGSGITRGRGDGSFGVDDAVTRGAMAAFLYRSAGSPVGPFDAPGFSDVPVGHVFEDEVAWLAGSGITQGRGDGSFGVDAAVTRGAMAALLFRVDARGER